MRMMLGWLLVTTTGCTAIKSGAQLARAEQAVTRAAQRNADDVAIYEYTMAIRHLEKAREENGYSDFKDSSAMSKSAIEWAEKAVEVVEMGGPQYRPASTPSAPASDGDAPDARELLGDTEPADEDLFGDDDLLEDE